MLKKSIIAAALLGALLLLAQPASAQVRFGVTVGSPGYYSYPYGYYPSYSYPVYSYPYAYPYVYRYPAYTNYYVAPRYVTPYVYRYEIGRRHRHHDDDGDRHWRR